MPWAGNIAKTMTSNKKQFTVTREMLTAVALFVFHRFDPFLLYNKSLNDWSLGEQWLRLGKHWEFSGNKFYCSPRDQSLSV